ECAQDDCFARGRTTTLKWSQRLRAGLTCAAPSALREPEAQKNPRMNTERELRIEMEGGGHVSAILVRPENAKSLLVLGHGAGAGMRHVFLEALAEELARAGVATLRYQFP